MDELTLFLAIIVAGFAFLLSIVSLLSYYRLRSYKLLFVNVAFLVFFIKGILTIFSFLIQDELGLIIDFMILIFLYLAIIKK